MTQGGRARGAWLILLASLIGLAVSLYDFVTPSTGLDNTGGVETVIIAQALMLGAGLVVALLGSGLIAGILLFLIGLDIVCSFAAAYFLESIPLMALMTVAAIGWIIRITARTPRPEQ